MNKFRFSTVFLFVLLFFPHNAFAAVIQTGNSSVQNTVTSVVNGSNCLTHIEVIVNGEKKVVDSNNCGTNSLNVNSNNNFQSPIPSASFFMPQKPIVTILPSQVSSVTATIRPLEKKVIVKYSFMANLIKTFSDFFKNISINIVKSLL